MCAMPGPEGTARSAQGPCVAATVAPAQGGCQCTLHRARRHRPGCRRVATQPDRSTRQTRTEAAATRRRAPRAPVPAAPRRGPPRSRFNHAQAQSCARLHLQLVHDQELRFARLDYYYYHVHCRTRARAPRQTRQPSRRAQQPPPGCATPSLALRRSGRRTCAHERSQLVLLRLRHLKRKRAGANGGARERRQPSKLHARVPPLVGAHG